MCCVSLTKVLDLLMTGDILRKLALDALIGVEISQRALAQSKMVQLLYSKATWNGPLFLAANLSSMVQCATAVKMWYCVCTPKHRTVAATMRHERLKQQSCGEHWLELTGQAAAMSESMDERG